MSKKKKFLIDIEEDGKFYKLLDEYRIERELSLTGAIKQLLFQKLEDMEVEKLKLNSNITSGIDHKETIQDVEEVETKPKKNMLKNLNRIKQD